MVARSIDGGTAWSLERPLVAEPPPSTTHTIRTTRVSDGTLVGLGGLHRRKDTQEGLVNRSTFGFVPVDLFLVRSYDAGVSWTVPHLIDLPLLGSSWEICHPIVELSTGRWLAPTATWRNWDGYNPAGERAIVLTSDDGGKTWPAYGCSFDGRETGHSHLEQSVVQLHDDRILSVSWVLAANNGKTFPSEYSLSSDHGETFGGPALTGFHAQTCKVIQLVDGRLLCAYRRDDKPGLWASLAKLEREKWINLEEAPLWLGADSGMIGQASTAEELSALRFGYPSMRQLPNGTILLLFWCQEKCKTIIRWIKVEVH